MFLKLLRVLHVQVPHIDPSLFIERFALQLNLGSKTQTVAHTAVRLVQAMKRDWIATGRRPMGLCGAALLIAARYHDIQIDAEDVAVAVRISCPTLSKRLYEFRRTAVAQLPAAALGETDLLQLPALPLPPCRLTKKRQQQQQQQQQQLQDGKKTLSLEDGPVAAAADSAAAAGPAAEAAADPAVAGEPAAEAANGDHRGPSAAAAAAANEGAGAPGGPQAAAAAEGEGQKEAAGDEQQRVCSSSDALCNEQPSSGDILSVAGWIVETISASPAAAADAAAGAAAPAAGDAAAAATTGTPAAESTDGRPAAGHAETGAAAAAAAAEPDGEEALQAAEGGDPLADLLRSVRARADELLLPTETQGLPTAASSGEGRAGACGPAAAAAAAAAEAAAAAGEAAEGLEEEDPEESEDGLEDMLLNEHEREAKALIW
ncbi:hypothetical protein ENH_00056790 [Eimeria necatrix]|uniref:Transcription factor TFIIB cyclin-like domain-containing protein n=1 Tax=Eimeria necatrix TaxID=51315 RepID=U6N062_9EIME|nr:hypothetical protein ENH_00056790 [Eimeria necatrix]CDJ68688.1 hypothetical protein ENH_00056790 [Eimeria necatrix]